MRIQELKCFGQHAGGGNPALVIEEGPGDAAARARLAQERNTTCVFLDPPGPPGIAAVLDFFYPHMRSPLCLHATLAAGRVLFARRTADAPLTVGTAMRGQALELSCEGEDLFVRLSAQAAPRPELAPDLPARLLAAPGLAPAAPPRVASVGSPKLLVEVADAATLHGLRPDLGLIAEWGKANGVNGCYAYCRLPDGRYEGRNFNHLDPALEDSATGVAAGALTALLGHGITLLQGRATGRDCLIRTRVEGGQVLVGGRAG